MPLLKAFFLSFKFLGWQFLFKPLLLSFDVFVGGEGEEIDLSVEAITKENFLLGFKGH